MSQENVKKKKQGKIVSLAELANTLGSTQPTVRKWPQDGMTHKSKGAHGKGYELDTAACIRWLIEKATSADGGSTNNFDHDRARKMSSDADKAGMDCDMMRGDLIDVSVAILTLDDTLVRYFAGIDLSGIIMEKVSAIASMLPDWAKDMLDTGDTPAAPVQQQRKSGGRGSRLRWQMSRRLRTC